MATVTAERAYARANLYRFLSLAFTHPSETDFASLLAAEPATRVAATLVGPSIASAFEAVAEEFATLTLSDLAGQHRHIFTLSASPDCPLNECAYSAKHVYQEVQALADLAGFYRAFGVEPKQIRPDELSAELEFCYLLSLKDGIAREHSQSEQAQVCRKALRHFVRDHVARWGENIGLRLQVLYPDSAYARFGRLLSVFMEAEIRRLKPGRISYYQAIPNPPPPMEEEGCPVVSDIGLFEAQDDGGDLAPDPVGSSQGGQE
jgi:TorA maturation chaperone TorD